MEKICKNCKWREDRVCMNDGKIHEKDYEKRDNANDDHLVYSYYESGGFEVGDNFGCVHFEENNRIAAKRQTVAENGGLVATTGTSVGTGEGD